MPPADRSVDHLCRPADNLSPSPHPNPGDPRFSHTYLFQGTIWGNLDIKSVKLAFEHVKIRKSAYRGQ